MVLIAAHHNAGVILVVTVHSVRYSLPLPPPPGISVPVSTSSEITRRKTSLTNQPTKTLSLSLSLSLCACVRGWVCVHHCLCCVYVCVCAGESPIQRDIYPVKLITPCLGLNLL